MKSTKYGETPLKRVKCEVQLFGQDLWLKWSHGDHCDSRHKGKESGKCKRIQIISDILREVW